LFARAQGEQSRGLTMDIDEFLDLASPLPERMLFHHETVQTMIQALMFS
jgi:hypothetical protein